MVDVSTMDFWFGLALGILLVLLLLYIVYLYVTDAKGNDDC